MDTLPRFSLFEVQEEVAYKLYVYVRFYYLYKKSNSGKIVEIAKKVHDCLWTCPLQNSGNRKMAESSILRNLLFYGFRPHDDYLKSNPYYVSFNIEVDCVEMYRFIVGYFGWLAGKLYAEDQVSVEAVRSALNRVYSSLS